MVRPGVVVDEDWEIHLHDEHEDDAWEADDSRKKRYYVGRCAFEKRDPATGRDTSFRIFSGRIRLPEQPARFRARSPIRVDSFSVTSPSECESDPSEFMESVEFLGHLDTHLEEYVLTKIQPSNNQLSKEQHL